MLRFTPILLAILYGIAMWHFSSWRLRKELDQKSTELADPRIAALTRRMAEALDLPRIRVNIYEITPVNGMAVPDGRIFLTRGFLDKYTAGEVTAEELASVIAHELGHVALNHTRRRLIDFSGQNAMRTALGMVLSRLVPGIGGWIATMLTSLLAARISRGDEYEADAYAAALLTRAEIGVDPQIRLFEKLASLTDSQGGAAPAWLLSHPKPEERIAAIRKLADGWSTG
ncbi:MAG: peptidase M48 [Pseudooceanicola sp.]|nr:peptidase M48 [Pseudooceanicola sp.]